MDATLRRLQHLFGQLGVGDRATLLAFAEFLVVRSPAARDTPAQPAAAAAPVARPEPIERPAQESIVAGLKRLAKTYPMLDKSEMLGATSDIVATHLMQGTEPARVIDELETIFRNRYEQLLAARGES